MSLVDLDAFKAAITIEDTVDDGDLQRALDAASDWITNYCGRAFEPIGTTAEARFFIAVTWDRLTVPDITSVSELAVDQVGDGSYTLVLSPSTYQLYPLNVGQPGIIGQYTEIRIRTGYYPGFIPGYGARVTGIWGFGDAPAAVEQACIMLASRYFHRLNAPFGVLESAQMGTFATIPGTDDDVIALLAPYGSASGSAAGSAASTWIVV